MGDGRWSGGQLERCWTPPAGESGAGRCQRKRMRCRSWLLVSLADLRLEISSVTCSSMDMATCLDAIGRGVNVGSFGGASSGPFLSRARRGGERPKFEREGRAEFRPQHGAQASELQEKRCEGMDVCRRKPSWRRPEPLRTRGTEERMRCLRSGTRRNHVGLPTWVSMHGIYLCDTSCGRREP